ncbi:MAG: hypothetical protein RBR70_06540 [Arcobacter sp.]|uniref:hypothetical protein n=1 Tax=Arcobacter sp. TaxID=1872629 RepID=UPI002A753AD3|nr:hypothetical protein [Arcobacter sp.]MDY3204712.1 hypothetical protein [Arcobacter sp.]
MKKITKISYLITTNVDFFDFNKNNIQKKNETKRLSNELTILVESADLKNCDAICDVL